MAGLTASPLGPTEGFNWVYLVELLICSILSLFFLFYFDRLFATILSYAIRAWTWHKYRAYIDITALQISPLGGRIFFKSVRYHAHNITVVVHDGNITWRYWLRQVQEAQIFKELNEKSDKAESSDDEQGSRKPKRTLPCRVSIKLSGVEVFIYNRSPSYDGIVEATLKKAQELARGHKTSESSHGSSGGKEELIQKESHDFADTKQGDIPFWLGILPIEVSCKRAAAAIGNENTTSLITATVEQSNGQINAGAAKLDLYKLLFDFEFKNVVVAMKENKDFTQSQSAVAHAVLRQESNPDVKQKRNILASFFRRRRRQNKGSVRTTSIKSQSVVEQLPGEAEWHGLSRYLTQGEVNDHAKWQDVEYAKATTLADCDMVTMRFYWDISSAVDFTSRSDPPPEYGIDLAVHGGTVTYGPWADRQRVNLQHVFFPASCTDAIPLPTRKAGEPRIASIFKLYLSIERDVTLRIPTRESSKDYLWQQQAASPPPQRNRKRTGKKQSKTATEKPDARPYGWLDVTVKPDSVVNYTMDMYARSTGYQNTIDLDIKSTEITTSANHALLWRTGPITLFGDLSNPLAWNSLRPWPFKIHCQDLDMFILRDHMFLIIDLVDDWGSGSSPDFYTFVPFRYNMDLSFSNFKLFLNTNDGNIIDDPSDMEQNDFLTLEGDQLDANLNIPLEHYRPSKNEITFDVIARNLSMRALFATKSTVKALVKEGRVAKLHHLTLKGTFCSNQEQSKGLTDVLRMDIEGDEFSLLAYGFVLRHLISIKENYFGAYQHFKTLEEFQHTNNQEPARIRPPTGNELDVILSIVVKQATLMLPTSLYAAPSFVKAELSEASVDLRATSYYLDLAIDLSPIGVQLSSEEKSLTSTQLFVSHATVTGHKAFGPPPHELSYVSTWDIDVGPISGELKEMFLHDTVLAGKALLFTFLDRENTLPLDKTEEIFDISFVQVRTSTLRIWLHAGAEAILLSTKPITVHVNDWANGQFSQSVNVLVPNLAVACIARDNRSHHESSRHRRVAKTHALIETTLALDVIGRKRHFATESLKQQAFLVEQDVRTHRAEFLRRSSPQWHQTSHPTDVLQDADPAAMPCPPIPLPLHSTGDADSRSVKTVKYAGQILLHTKASRSSSGSNSSDNNEVARNSSVAAPASLTAFSSTYASPVFPLDVYEYDRVYLPPPHRSGNASKANTIRSESSAASAEGYLSDKLEHTAVLIDLASGIQGFVDAKIIDVVAHLLEALQPRAVEEVMDAFQISIMSEIEDKLKAQSIQPSAFQIAIDLPHAALRVLNASESRVDQDVADVSLTGLHFMLRTTEGIEAGRKAIAAHAKLAKLCLRLTEGIDGPRAINLDIDDLLFWLASSAVGSLRLIIANTAVDVTATSAMYIAGFVGRLLPMIAAAQERFGDLSRLDAARLQLLLYQLTQFGEHVNDPPFLTMMTYVLRAYPSHYRNQESWKVLMRFRSILLSLPRNIRNDLESTLSGDEIACPQDAAQKMLDSWAQWRNWDVINVGRTMVFRTILGTPADAMPGPAAPLSATWTQDRISLAISHPQGDSTVELKELSIGMEIKPQSAPTGLMLVEENTRSSILSHIHTARVSIELCWNLLGIAELVLADILAAIPVNHNPHAQQSSLAEGLIRHTMHIALSADTGSISLRTIHVHHWAQAEGLKLSVIGTTQADAPYGACVVAILNADRAGTQLYSPAGMVWESLLISPSIYIDNLHYTPDSGLPPSISTAIAYKDIELSVKEQLPGVLGLVDNIINAEVTQVMRLVSAFSGPDSSQPSALQPVASAASTTLQTTKFSLALLAGELVVEVALLQSLRYRLNGKAASVRVVPSMNIDQQLTVDIETGHLNHFLVNNSGGAEHRQQIVNVPPINAHIVTLFSRKKQEITAQGLVGQLIIDAEALQSVLNTINKPEVKGVIKAAGDSIDDIQDSVAALQQNSPTPEAAHLPDDIVLQYHVTIGLAGIKVAASTPRGPKSTTAEFEIGVGKCHAVISNAASIDQKEGLLFPEIKGSLEDIGAKLYVKDRTTTYPAGNLTFGVDFELNVSMNEHERMTREFVLQSSKFEIRAFPETAAIAVDIVNQMQDRLKQLDLSQEFEYLTALRSRRLEKENKDHRPSDSTTTASANQWTTELLAMQTVVKLRKIEMTWMVPNEQSSQQNASAEDLVLSLDLIELTTHGGEEGRLMMKDLQVQLVHRNNDKTKRTMNSALLPEVIFSVVYWSQGKDKHLALKASGKPLDLRLDSRFIVPFNAVQRSMTYAIDKFKAGTVAWEAVPTTSGMPRGELFSSLHIASLVAEADFAGAQVLLRGTSQIDRNDAYEELGPPSTEAGRGRYGQFAPESGVMQTTLRSPGIAFKLQYDNHNDQPSVKAEMLVASSSNMLLPNVVPLILEVSKSVKEVIQKDASAPATLAVASTALSGDDEASAPPPNMTESLVTTDPSSIFGKTKASLNLRIARQEFGLTCQPIAKVDAKAEMEDLYFSLSTIESDELGHFFAISAIVTQVAVKVQHQYSRESTLGFEISSIDLSLMNSRHFSGVNGISAILKVDPAKMAINGKQLQDLLLFREIWLPPEMRSAASLGTESPAQNAEEVLMQKYQTMAIAAAFPWNVAVTFVELGVDLDLGQGLGKTAFKMHNLWASSEKSSDWEQNLCIGVEELSMTSRGRMSGHIILSNLGVRTSIDWPDHAESGHKTPRIQASVKFDRIRAKAAFDYQAFAFADIEGLQFVMYNVDDKHSRNDRLITMLDCSKVYVFCTSTSPAQAFALYQAVERLIQEKQAAFNLSLKDIEKHLRRESTVIEVQAKTAASIIQSPANQLLDLAPISLHTDVVVSLGNISVGAFPSTFFDSQILKFEASNLQARFGAGIDKKRVKSDLGMTIGQLSVALAAVKKGPMPKSINDIDVDEVIVSAVDAKGGVILRVPRVVATMTTWQIPDVNRIEYIFSSLFEGKVDIGWNLSRINFIRGMWTTQSRALAARLGKPLPESAVKITAAPNRTAEDPTQEKITAEINLPQSRYEYIALEPPIIETPQLRDMGEATPPLEWIGLNRDKLPNVTHQIIIVSLLRIAKEVEDAYQRILGTS